MYFNKAITEGYMDEFGNTFEDNTSVIVYVIVLFIHDPEHISSVSSPHVYSYVQNKYIFSVCRP